MFKNLVKALMVLMLVPVVGLSGPKAVKDFTGTITVSLFESATGSGVTTVPVSDIGNAYIWNRMTGTVRMLNMTSDTATLIHENDTLIMTLKMVGPYRVDTLSVDTIYPSVSDSSTSYKVYEFYKQKTTATHYSLDSAGAVSAGNDPFVNSLVMEDDAWLSLALDQIVLDWAVTDSAAVGGTTSGQIQYWFRFFDEE